MRHKHLAECSHPFLDDPKPSAAVVAGGCDVLRCPRCGEAWLLYLDAGELVIYGQGSDGSSLTSRPNSTD
jgi:hypothetical protein